MSTLLHTPPESSVKSANFSGINTADTSRRPWLIEQYRHIRETTEQLVVALGPEDQNLQPMPEASPVKWHRAHTSWFFETFVLRCLQKSWQWVNPRYCELFNSYYNGIGRQHPRAMRSLMSRPDHTAVTQYRQRIDQAVIQLIDSIEESMWPTCHNLILIGLNHEQQHQELMLTDFKACLPMNPLAPALGFAPNDAEAESQPPEWIEFDGGLIEIGVDNSQPGFHFDNETPKHQVFLNQAYALASRPSVCEEFKQFIDDGGYQTASLWLADGWSWVQNNQIKQPLYWKRLDEQWHHHTLSGLRPIEPAEPICHLSFYEAAAFAEWSGARLPTEAEWEHAAKGHAVQGHFADWQRYQPEAISVCTEKNHEPALQQLFGSVWEWTQSSYSPYPGFRAAKGAIGEYNGKFMANQIVLRGGSCATAVDHVRASYRNFFYPVDRWQFSGVRLARNLS